MEDLHNYFSIFTETETQNNASVPYYQHVLPLQVNNLIYLPCTKKQHQTEPLSMLCIDTKCHRNGLICAMCEDEHHRKHLCVPLKGYLGEVFGGRYGRVGGGGSEGQHGQKEKKGQLRQCEQEKSLLIWCQKMDEIREHQLSILGACRESVNEKINMLELLLNKMFDNARREIHQVMSLSDPVQKIAQISSHRGQDNNQKQHQAVQLQKYIEKMLKTTNHKQKFSVERRISEIFTSTQQIAKFSTKSLKQISTKFQTSMKQPILLLQREKDSNKIGSNLKGPMLQKKKYQFSQVMKGSKMVVKQKGKILQQTGMQSTGQRFALLQPSLSTQKLLLKSKQQVQTWGIKIIKVAGWIGVGIGLRKTIQKTNYNFLYTNIGHGGYLISHNGYCWSHSKLQQNSKSLSFSYTTNDIVYIRYDPQNKLVKFMKNNKQGVYQMEVVDPGDDEYHPCVNVCMNGDQVEIINNVQVVFP